MPTFGNDSDSDLEPFARASNLFHLANEPGNDERPDPVGLSDNSDEALEIQAFPPAVPSDETHPSAASSRA